jgi:hypothetical protein
LLQDVLRAQLRASDVQRLGLLLGVLHEGASVGASVHAYFGPATHTIGDTECLLVACYEVPVLSATVSFVRMGKQGCASAEEHHRLLLRAILLLLRSPS